MAQNEPPAAEIFRSTNLREASARKDPAPRLFIGVDGGGSGCRASIADASGRMLGSGAGGPAAVRFGLRRSLAAVESACRDAAANAGFGAADLHEMDAVVGLAGIGREGVLEALSAQPHPFKSLRYVNDATIACIGAHGGRDGGVVVVGTGSVGLARIDHREIRFGGYGFPISDEGSGAALGLAAIRLALRAHDGRAPKTALADELLGRFGNNPFEIVTWADHATATDYATLGPLVMRHAERKDDIAQSIVRSAAAEIDELILRVAQSGAPRISLLGGLAPQMGPWLAPAVQSLLEPADGDAVDGALLLARCAAQEPLFFGEGLG